MLDEKIQALSSTRGLLEQQFVENSRLKVTLDNQGPLCENPIGKDEEIVRMRGLMQEQMDEFDAMKCKLMKDLQDRCEKVVDLEISLDEMKEQVLIFI